MDNFFDLFEEIDLEHIDKILIGEDEKDKFFKIYRKLKESVKLKHIAEVVKKIKSRIYLDQIGRGRPTIRSVSAQNARNNAPISTATRSHTVAAAGGN